MKKIAIVLLILSVIVIALFGFMIYKSRYLDKIMIVENRNLLSIHDGTYLIEGQQITLKNGISETEIAPGSAAKVTTKYFGNEVAGDFDNDGREDRAFLLTQNSGGSGTFYYVVALLNTEKGFIGSAGFLLGDRIAPQMTNIDEGKTVSGTNRQNVIVVNYADRNPGESFAVPPSVGKSIWLKLDPKTLQFGEVAQNFEGESGVTGTN